MVCPLLIDTAKPLLDELMGGASFWISPGLYREVPIHD
jgi:predicted nucleic acid-binding protein